MTLGTDHEKSRGALSRSIIAAVVIAVCAVMLLSVANTFRAMTEGRTAEVPPGDRHANYLLFPKTASAGIVRAIIVNGTELTRPGAFSYFDGASEKQIARDQMSLYPPSSPEVQADCIAGLNAEIGRWGEKTDIRKVSFSIEGTRATLTKQLKNGKIDRYTYVIRADFIPSAISVRYGL